MKGAFLIHNIGKVTGKREATTRVEKDKTKKEGRRGKNDNGG